MKADLAVLLTGCLLLCSGAASAADYLTIPVTVEEPSIAGAVAVRDGEPIFRQALRAGAIVTTSDFAMRYETVSIAVIAGPPGPFDFVIPSGTILVQANWKGATVYCTSKTLKDAFWSYLDAALCFSDADHDGKLETLYSSDMWPSRIRSVSNILGLANARSAAIALPYAEMDSASLPRFQVEAVAGHYTGLLDRRANVALRLCSPEKADLKSESDRMPERCSPLDWGADGVIPADDRVGSPMLYTPRADDQGQGRIVWGPVSISYTLQSRDIANAKLESAVPVGPATMVRSGAVWYGTNLQGTISVLHLEPLSTDKVSNTAPKTPGGDL